jgi:fatty acid-binding protein DegV
LSRAVVLSRAIVATKARRSDSGRWLFAAVVTDSTHYIPREITERHGLHTVSLYVRWGDPPRDEREGELPDFDAFYEYLRSARELPTTSQPSVGDFLAVYGCRPSRAPTSSRSISPAGSRTVRAAEQARDQLVERGARSGSRRRLGDRVYGPRPMASPRTTRSRPARRSPGGPRARKLRERMKILFAVTRRFSAAAGGSARGWIGSTPKIKPIWRSNPRSSRSSASAPGAAFER